MKKYSLEIAVFLCGALLMILELAGSRVLAPYIGTSIVVWTSLIGVIMGFLALGYWYGGRLADRGAKTFILSYIISAAAFFSFLIIFINEPILNFSRAYIRNLYFGALFSTIFLFAAPSFLLGLVSPYAARLKIKELESSGQAIGNLYALSTIGSIVGTFSAGFLLIPFLGTIRILYLIAILLVAASIIVFSSRFLKTRMFAVLILLGLLFFSLWQSAKAEKIDIDTRYNRLWVYPSIDAETKRPLLRLATDPFAIQSGMFLDKDDELTFRYLKYYRLGDFFNPDIKRGLVIGGAAYSYPKDFLKSHPNASLDVAEIDPGMTKIAKKYFNLKDDPRLKIYHEDGRVFLNNNKEKYDAIYFDAFTSHLSIPYQLTTKEAVQKISDSLSADGVVLANIISGIEGEKGKFLRAEYATYKEVFPQVYLFRVYNNNPANAQNLILVGLKNGAPRDLQSASAELDGYLDMVWRREIKADLPILTDDFAPVDYYALSMI